MTRTKADYNLIWKHTHRDYKGRINGDRYLLALREGGTHSVPIESLTDEEFTNRLGCAKRAEQRAKENAARKIGALCQVND